MAGVGFELKRIFRDNGGALNSIKGYSITAVVTEGPMILMIVMLLVLRYLMSWFGSGRREQEIFVFFMTYAMIFSHILANSILMFINRFISDCIYQERLENILPSFFGMVFFLLLIGGPLAIIYILTLPVSFGIALAGWLLFGIMTIMWVQMAYLSAVKRYEFELIGFLAGSVGAILIAAVLMLLGVSPLPGALWGTVAGFLIMLFTYMAQILFCYPMGKFNLMIFFPQLEKYWILAVIGICMALGLYIHNFVFWLSSYRNQIFPTGVFCTKYDVPTFFAVLTITPMLVQFVVSVETRFSVKNRNYFDTILYGGSLDDIRAAKEEMQSVLYAELLRMMENQLVFTIIAVIYLGNVLQSFGLDSEMVNIFRLLCFGYYIYGLLKCGIILLLYFDDRKGACIGAVLFVALSAGLSLVTLALGIKTWGAGFLFAAAISSVWVLLRLKTYVRELEYRVFCEQPLFTEEEDGVLSNIETRISNIEKRKAQRRKDLEEDMETNVE